MITVKKTDIQPILTIIQAEKNQQVRTKLEQWVAVNAVPGNELPETNSLIGIAQSSSQKAAIIAWANGLTS